MNVNLLNRKTALFAAVVAVSLPGVATAQMNDDSNATDDSGTIVIRGDQPNDSQQQGGETGELTPAQAEAQQRQRTANRQAGQQDAQAQQASSQEKQQLDQQKVETWFKHAASGNQFEVESAKLAQQRAQDQQVKTLARTVEQDHSRALETLRQQAQQAKVEIASKPELMPVHQAMLEALRQKQGADFDRAYVFGQDAGHRAVALEYGWVQNHVSNQPIVAYVDQTLPTIKQHHGKVHQLAQRMAGITDDGSQQGQNARLSSGGDVNAPSAEDAANRVGNEAQRTENQLRQERDRVREDVRQGVNDANRDAQESMDEVGDEMAQ